MVVKAIASFEESKKIISGKTVRSWPWKEAPSDLFSDGLLPEIQLPRVLPSGSLPRSSSSSKSAGIERRYLWLSWSPVVQQVIVHFGATWCGPSKMMIPIFESLSNQNPQVGFYSVDADSQQVSFCCKTHDQVSYYQYIFWQPCHERPSN